MASYVHVRERVNQYFLSSHLLRRRRWIGFSLPDADDVIKAIAWLFLLLRSLRQFWASMIVTVAMMDADEGVIFCVNLVCT